VFTINNECDLVHKDVSLGDLGVVLSARASLLRTTEGDEKRDRGLMNRLLQDRHMSPWETPVHLFAVTAPTPYVYEFLKYSWAPSNHLPRLVERFEKEKSLPSLSTFFWPVDTRSLMDFINEAGKSDSTLLRKFAKGTGELYRQSMPWGFDVFLRQTWKGEPNFFAS